MDTGMVYKQTLGFQMDTRNHNPRVGGSSPSSATTNQQLSDGAEKRFTFECKPRTLARTLTEEDWLWFWWPNGGFGEGAYSPEKFASFLSAAGYSDGRPGVPPELPEWAVEETEEQHQLWRKRGIPPELTYFARGTYTGRIKIGMTTQRPEVRVSQLRNDARNGEDAELLVTRRGSHFESLYHRAFHTWRVGGEWFSPHPDILAEIERLTA